MRTSINTTASEGLLFSAQPGRGKQNIREEIECKGDETSQKARAPSVKARSWRRHWSAAVPKMPSLALACTILGASFNTSYSHAPTSPPPELERFAWMIGDWDTAATYRFAPEAPTSNMRSTQTVRWALNKQFLVSEQEGLMPNGWHAKLIITAWNEKVRSYKMIDVDLTGAVTELSMTVDGDTRTIVYHPVLGGRRIRTELKVFHVSDVEYTTRGECSDLDKTWICYDAVSKKRSPGVTN